MATVSDILTGLWYLACPSSSLKQGALIRRIFFGDPVVLGRTNDGKVFALHDVCPHRAAPLSKGRIIETGDTPCIECPYHGWRFRTDDGGCAKIPSLSESDAFDPAPISVNRYELHEANGVIWILHGEKGNVLPPSLGVPENFVPRTVTTVQAHGPFDEAVIGLVDPAHTPFVHKQWWWREGKAAEEKEKQFEPTALGFRMPPHRPSSNSRIYGFLGGAPTTEIEFRLPGVRLETIRNDKHTILGLTAMTPTEKNATQITHLIFWDMPLLTALKPIAAHMANSFLAQDGAILNAQNENLSRQDHRPLYAGEPDIPAQWYHALKRAWRRSEGQTDFIHPLSAQSLHWRT